MADETEVRPDPDWYPNPDGPGLRYFDGNQWTGSYHPGRSSAPSHSEVLWALSLGFGATGAVGAIAIPIIAFYFPLGFGIAGAALAVAAFTSEGNTPWYTVLALIATLVALVAGISAYGDFQDTQEDVESLQQEFDF